MLFSLFFFGNDVKHCLECLLYLLNPNWNKIVKIYANLDQARVVQKADNAIHTINHYPADSVVCFVNTYPLDSNLSDA